MISGPGDGGAGGDAVAVGSGVGDWGAAGNAVAVGSGVDVANAAGANVGSGVPSPPEAVPQALMSALAIRSKTMTVPSCCLLLPIFSPPPLKLSILRRSLK